MLERTAESVAVASSRGVIRCSDFSANRADRPRLERCLKQVFGVVNELGEHVSLLTGHKFKLPFEFAVGYISITNT